MSNPKPRLHHACYGIAEGRLDIAVELLSILGCETTFRPPSGQSWAMVGQPGLAFDLQLVEYAQIPVTDLDAKRRIHIAFISDDPALLIQKVEAWASDKQLDFRQGGWSDKERYFDLQDVFVNFVVEVMHTSVESE